MRQIPANVSQSNSVSKSEKYLKTLPKKKRTNEDRISDLLHEIEKLKQKALLNPEGIWAFALSLVQPYLGNINEASNWSTPKTVELRVKETRLKLTFEEADLEFTKENAIVGNEARVALLDIYPNLTDEEKLEATTELIGNKLRELKTSEKYVKFFELLDKRNEAFIAWRNFSTNNPQSDN